jgi:hypothetical protein
MKRLLVLVATATIAACGSGIRTANPVQPGTLTFSMSGTISELDEEGARISNHWPCDGRRPNNGRLRHLAGDDQGSGGT